MIFKHSTNFYHDVLDAEVREIYVDVEATWKLADNTRASYPSCYIPLTEGTDRRVVVRRVQSFRLHVDCKLAEHLVQLEV